MAAKTSSRQRPSTGSADLALPPIRDRLTQHNARVVEGHRVLPTGGHHFSLLTARVLPTGGHESAHRQGSWAWSGMGITALPAVATNTRRPLSRPGRRRGWGFRFDDRGVPAGDDRGPRGQRQGTHRALTTGTANRPSRRSICSAAVSAVAWLRRCSRSATVPWGSGPRSASCSRDPRASGGGGTRSATCSTRCPSPRRRCCDGVQAHRSGTDLSRVPSPGYARPQR
jgi:hypothetical protein